jgi:hypothetical protein
MRTSVSQMALNNPFFSNASIAYSLHVGVNLQDGGSIGDRKRL